MTTVLKWKKFLCLAESSAMCKQFSSQCINYQITKEECANVIHAKDLPGPPNIPILNSMLYMMRHKEYEKNKMFKLMAAMDKEFGPTYKFHISGCKPIIVFSQPEDVQRMYSLTEKNPLRIEFFTLKKTREKSQGNVCEKKLGIIAENDVEWWRVRSKVQGPMLKLQNVRTYLSPMDQISIDFVNSISKMLDEKNETPESFLLELYKWALESIGGVSLNTRLGCLSNNLTEDSEQLKLINAINSLLENSYKAEMFPLWHGFQRKTYKKLIDAHHYVQRVTEKNIKMAEAAILQRKGESFQPSILEAFLKTDSLSRTDITIMILDMFMAGIDTTSHTVAFALYELSRNKESQIRLQKEIDDVLGDGKLSISESDWSKFTYLKACLKETLRLYPIVIEVFRQFESDVVINNIHIPREWHGMFSNMIMGRNESLFRKAEEFIPERWLSNKPLGKSHPYSSLPFSHGKRNCIGRRIAEQEIIILLARIFQRYNVSYNYGEMEYIQHLVLVPSKPLKFQFTPRR